jgi:hypothetical protein
MMPMPVKEYITQIVELRSSYADVAAKVRAFAQNRVGLMPSPTAVSEVIVAGGQSDGYEI